MSNRYIRADELAKELGLSLQELFDRVLAGEWPMPCWNRDELVRFVANWIASKDATERSEADDNA